MSFPTADNSDVRHGDHALVLKPVLKSEHVRRETDAMLEEAVGLARAIELVVVQAAVVTIANPTPSTLFGKGQVENYGNFIKELEILLVVVDHTLSPVQQRNLEREWKCKVIDRTGLILEIFGERARTREGQLQVELAALDYQKSRLVRSWTHLERQRGGFGFLGGPGESQLELDRRLITQRIVRLKEDLKQVRRTRGLQRENRQRAGHPTIALVGYTNAGKSSLFNRLTGSDVLAKDMLFATLDPTMRGIKLAAGREAILSDTVGFISDLPTHLVEAFRATLEEVQLADIILHVRDVAHPEARAQREAVMDILADLGIGQEDERLVEVLNKIDLLPEDERHNLQSFAARTTEEVQMFADRMGQSVGESSKTPPPLRGRLGGRSVQQTQSPVFMERTPPLTPPSRGGEYHRSSVTGYLEGLRPEPRGGVIGISALTGEGMDEFLKLIDDKLAAQSTVYDIDVPLTDGAALSWLHAHGKIIDKRDTKTKSRIKIELDAADYGRFQSRFGKEKHDKD